MYRLLVRFLKAGILSEDQFLRTSTGTPQVGIASPLLANIALRAIEERYERWTRQRETPQARRKCDVVKAAQAARSTDRRRGRPVFFPIRYADDFIVLVSGTYDDVRNEKSELREYLASTLHLQLSPERKRPYSRFPAGRRRGRSSLN